jgi:hypothetical protein
MNIIYQAEDLSIGLGRNGQIDICRLSWEIKDNISLTEKWRGDPDIAGQARFEYNSSIFIKTTGFNHTGDQ